MHYCCDQVKPAFGVATDELDLCMPNGVIPYGPRFDRLLETGRKFIAQARAHIHIVLYIRLLYYI